MLKVCLKGGSRPLALSFFKKGVIMVVIALVVFMLNLITAIHYLTLAIKVSLIADAWIIAIFVGVATLNLVSAIIMAMVAKEGFEKRKG